MSGPAVAEGMFSDPVDVSGGTITAAPTPNRAAWTARTAEVVTAGTPVQGPDVAVPNGFSVAIIFRATQAGSPKGYMADSGANTALSASRTEMNKGDVRVLFVTNLNLLFFDTDTSGAVFDLVLEQ